MSGWGTAPEFDVIWGESGVKLGTCRFPSPFSDDGFCSVSCVCDRRVAYTMNRDRQQRDWERKTVAICSIAEY